MVRDVAEATNEIDIHEISYSAYICAVLCKPKRRGDMYRFEKSTYL